MSIEERMEESAARCQGIIRRYHACERTDGARALMIAEIQTVVGWILELNPPAGATERLVMDRVDEHLLSRYGHEVGRRLNNQFVEAFEAAGMMLLKPSMEHRSLNRSETQGV